MNFRLHRFLLALAVNGMALALLIGGGGLGTVQRALAAGSSSTYSETWTAGPLFRHFGLPGQYVTLGPAQWKVSGTTSAGGSWTEDWKVPDSGWSKGACSIPDFLGFSATECQGGSYFTSSATPSYKVDRFPQPGWNVFWLHYQAGLYGASTNRCQANDPDTCKTITQASWPLTWTVTGTVTTP